MARKPRKTEAREPRRFHIPGAFGVDDPRAESPATPSGRIRRSFMVETNLGGTIEKIPGFDMSRIMTGGLFGPGRSSLQVSPPLKREPGPQTELAFGEGPDWTPVPDTSGVPWRSICHLTIRFAGATAQGTGWFVSQDTIITAGHNIYDPRFGWAEAVTITPGKNGATVDPYGFLYAVKGDVHPKWIESKGADLTADLAYLKINDPAIGKRLGWFGLRVLTDAEIRESPLIIHSAGYPAVKPRGTQWVDASRIGDFDAQHIYYRLDTWGGNSGAPIFATFSDGQRQVVASHSHGTADRTSNAGVRITDAIFDQIEAWIG
jgi:V8-like Glu-specific endopeptidase